MDEPVDFNREKDVFGLDKRDVHPFTESTDESPKRIKRIKRIKRKSPWLAALLSLMMMGLGHVYAGKIKKGILCYLGFLIIVFSIRFLAFQFYIFVGVLALVFLYWVFVIVDAFRTVSRNPEPQRQKYDRWYTYLLIIAVQAILLEIVPKSALDRNTPINFAHIPTPAMRPTLKIGDYIAFHRTKDIQQNYPVLFKYPKDTVTMYIKRCIGMPGDNVAITSGEAFINGSMVDDINKLEYQYLLTTHGQSLNPRLFERNGLEAGAKVGTNAYRVFMTVTEAGKFSKHKTIKDVQRFEFNDYSHLFPNSDSTGWTVDNYGPLYIPEKGTTVALTQENILLYASIIQEENRLCSTTDSTIHINGKLVQDYTFKRNYYFMLGDSRHNSLDSRFWGFVNENYIIGQALYVYMADNSDRVGMKIK